MAVSQLQQTARRRRRHERGVAAMELALGLPVLMVLAFGTFALGRIGMTKVRLDGWTNQAAHTCALKRNVDTVAGARTCVDEYLARGPLSACGDSLTSSVVFETFQTPFVTDEGVNAVQSVPTLRAEVECTVTPLRGAPFLAEKRLTAVATASRN